MKYKIVSAVGGDSEFTWGPFQLNSATGHVKLRETLRGGLNVFTLEVEARDDGSCCPDAPGMCDTLKYIGRLLNE